MRATMNPVTRKNWIEKGGRISKHMVESCLTTVENNECVLYKHRRPAAIAGTINTKRQVQCHLQWDKKQSLMSIKRHNKSPYIYIYMGLCSWLFSVLLLFFVYFKFVFLFAPLLRIQLYSLFVRLLTLLACFFDLCSVSSVYTCRNTIVNVEFVCFICPNKIA